MFGRVCPIWYTMFSVEETNICLFKSTKLEPENLICQVFCAKSRTVHNTTHIVQSVSQLSTPPRFAACEIAVPGSIHRQTPPFFRDAIFIQSFTLRELHVSRYGDKLRMAVLS